MFPCFATSLCLLCSLALFFGVAFSVSAETVRPIVFPVAGDYTFRDDWHEPRGGGTRQHIGNDIIAPKMTPLLAAVDGVVSFVARPEVSWGYEIEIKDDEGYAYDYLHVNNDTPGTDDGAGGETHAYMPGIVHGVRVSRGSTIGWVGDSGNAEETVSHLHFEIRDLSNANINPFPSLFAASGGKGVSQSAPRPTAVDVSLAERKVELRYIFTKELSLEAQSSEVRQLQLVLKAFGHFSHPSATGYFGPVTQSAVMSYQRKKHIPESGRVDAATREKLNDDLGTYDPNLYKPFYNAAEQRALDISRLLQQITILKKQLAAMGGHP